MRKIIYSIENSFESDKFGGTSDVIGGVVFLVAMFAGISWLLF